MCNQKRAMKKIILLTFIVNNLFSQINSGSDYCIVIVENRTEKTYIFKNKSTWGLNYDTTNFIINPYSKVSFNKVYSYPEKSAGANIYITEKDSYKIDNPFDYKNLLGVGNLFKNRKTIVKISNINSKANFEIINESKILIENSKTKSGRKSFKIKNQVDMFPYFSKEDPNALRIYLKKEIDSLKNLNVIKEILYIKVKFIVYEDGKISNTKVINSNRNELNTDIEKIFNGMPKWVPGIANGKKAKIEDTYEDKF